MGVPDHLIEAQALQRRKRLIRIIVVASVIVGCAFFVFVLPKLRRDHFARILHSMGSVYTERNVQGGPSPYTSNRVTSIVLRGEQVDDAWIKSHSRQIARGPFLRLDFENTRCGCESLKAIGSLRNLSTLTLNSKTFDDECVIKYARLQVDREG